MTSTTAEETSVIEKTLKKEGAKEGGKEILGEKSNRACLTVGRSIEK